MIAGGVPYAEVNPAVAIAAIQQGADIRMIAMNSLTVAEFVWAVKKDSPIQSMKDVRGKKLGYTNPRSTSQGLVQELVKRSGLKVDEVELVRTGGFGEGVAALESGIIDVAPIPEPLWSKFKDKYRPIARASEMLPPLANVVAVTTKNMAEERGDFIRAVIRGRMRAVEFMKANPKEAGEIVAKRYNLEPEEGRAAVTALANSVTEGVPYWGGGQFHMGSLSNMVELQKGIGALKGEIDLKGMIDTRFLPKELQELS
jgi:NitT/TauT family transport system substrate-binding protein